MKDLINHINNTYQLSETSWKELIKLFKVKTYPSDYKLLEIGEKSKYFFFSLKGIVRSYKLCKDGKEFNSNIFTEKNYLGIFSSLISKKPSELGLECLTECELVRINYDHFVSLSDKHIDLNILHRKNLRAFYVSLIMRERELANLTSTDRYLALKERIPSIDNLISQKHIASHLGITPVQLSRLKKDLYSSNS